MWLSINIFKKKKKKKKYDDYKYEITNVLGLLIDNIQININLTVALR